MQQSLCFILTLLLFSCVGQEEKEMYTWQTLEVTVTAYNSVASQTQGNPIITAWGDSLKPEIKSIAVSRNLIALGLKHNTPVKIEGLEGVYVVKDKMNRRWRNRIDIYMGTDIEKAKIWGRKKRTIHYGILKDSTFIETDVK